MSIFHSEHAKQRISKELALTICIKLFFLIILYNAFFSHPMLMNDKKAYHYLYSQSPNIINSFHIVKPSEIRLSAQSSNLSESLSQTKEINKSINTKGAYNP